MMKILILVGCIACVLTGCRKDPAIPGAAKSNSVVQTDSLTPFVGTYAGLCYWSVAGGPSSIDTVTLNTVESTDKSMINVYDGPGFYSFDASAIIRHHYANTSGPTSTLQFSNDSLIMFVMAGPRFYHYYCRKQ